MVKTRFNPPFCPSILDLLPVFLLCNCNSWVRILAGQNRFYTARREGRVQEDNLEHFVEGLMCSSAREDGHPHKLSYILGSFDTTQFHFQFHIRLCNQPTVAATLVLVQYL